MRPVWGRHGSLSAKVASQEAEAIRDEEASPIAELGQVEFPCDDFPSLHHKPGTEEEHQQIANQFTKGLSSSLFSSHSIISFL